MEKEMTSDKNPSKSSSELEARNEDHESANNEDSISDETGQAERQISVESVVVEMVVNREGTTNVYVRSEDHGEGEPKNDEHSAKPIRSDEVDEYSPVLRVQIRVLHHAWAASRNALNFFPKATVLIFTILGWMLCCGGIPFVSITMVIIGSIFMGDCNVQPKIPLYLVVGGVCGSVRHVLAVWMTCLPHDWQSHRKKSRDCLSFLNCTMMLFQFVWFIFGCVWVYGVQEVNYQDSSSGDYCHKTVYYFAFWLLSLYLLFVAIVVLMILTFCCIFCVVSAFASR